MTITNAVISALLRVHSERTMLIVLGALTASLLVLAYLALVLPNASYTEIFITDVMGLTDGAYRTFMGQVPSIDFKSLYGVAIYYPAALGFYLDFNTGAVLGFGHFITAVPLLIMAALACYRRFPILHSVIFLVFLFLLIVVPMRLGGSVNELTYGIYYTRHGWAALAIAWLFYLEPRTIRRNGLIVDSIILSLLLLFLLYCKITFAAVALAFVVINGFTSRYKMHLSLVSLSFFVAVVAAIQLFTEYNTAYFNDIFSVVRSTPGVRHSLYSVVAIVSGHLWIFILCLTALMAAYMAGHRSFFDLVFVTGCIISSFRLLDMSGGTNRGLPALIAVFLIFGELARRMECRIKEEHTSSSWAAKLASASILGMLLAFASEPMVRNALALRDHFHETIKVQPVAEGSLAGFLIGTEWRGTDVHEILGHDDAAHALFNRVRDLRGSRGDLKAWEYLPLVAEGVKLLESVPHDNHSVISLEQTNPFSVLLRMRPTKYGYPLFYVSDNRATRASNLTPPEIFFSDADYVMVPEVPLARHHLDLLLEAYGPYLEDNFHELKRSSHWRLYARS